MDNSATFPLLEKYRKEILNLISVDDFYKEYELKSDSRCCNDKINPTKEK